MTAKMGIFCKKDSLAEAPPGECLWPERERNRVLPHTFPATPDSPKGAEYSA